MIKRKPKPPALFILPALSAPAALALLLAGYLLQALFYRSGATRVNHSAAVLAMAIVVAAVGTAATLFAMSLRGLRSDRQVGRSALAAGCTADAVLFVVLLAASRVFPGDAGMIPFVVLFFSTYGALGISCCLGLPCLLVPELLPRTGWQLAGFVVWAIVAAAAGGAFAAWQGGDVLSKGLQFMTHSYGVLFAWASAAGAWRAHRRFHQAQVVRG